MIRHSPRKAIVLEMIEASLKWQQLAGVMSKRNLRSDIGKRLEKGRLSPVTDKIVWVVLDPKVEETTNPK